MTNCLTSSIGDTLTSPAARGRGRAATTAARRRPKTRRSLVTVTFANSRSPSVSRTGPSGLCAVKRTGTVSQLGR
jgi:hypothetical protein